MSFTDNVIKLIFLQHGHRKKKKKSPKWWERKQKSRTLSPIPSEKNPWGENDHSCITDDNTEVQRGSQAFLLRPLWEKKKGWCLGKKLAPQSQGRLKRGDGKARLLPSCLGVIPDWPALWPWASDLPCAPLMFSIESIMTALIWWSPSEVLRTMSGGLFLHLHCPQRGHQPRVATEI